MKQTDHLKWVYRADDNGGLWWLEHGPQHQYPGRAIATDTTGKDGFSMLGWPGEPYVKVKETV